MPTGCLIPDLNGVLPVYGVDRREEAVESGRVDGKPRIISQEYLGMSWPPRCAAVSSRRSAADGLGPDVGVAASVLAEHGIQPAIEEGPTLQVMIWINGAFGSGKTTLANELHRRLPEALAFDPEYVGYILTRCVPNLENGDFQDIPLWRKLVAEFAIGLSAEYGRPLIIPMTLVNAAYREEIFGLINKAGDQILHVFLDVPAEELRRRIDTQVIVEDNPKADASARAFRHRNVEQCVAARAELRADAMILQGDQHPPTELADLVMAALPASRQSGP
jgi:predicted kinase